MTPLDTLGIQYSEALEFLLVKINTKEEKRYVRWWQLSWRRLTGRENGYFQWSGGEIATLNQVVKKGCNERLTLQQRPRGEPGE